MKNLLYVLLFATIASVTYAQQSPIIDFIDDLSGSDKSITSIMLGPEMSGMIGGEDKDDVSGIFSDFKGMRIMVVEEGHKAAFDKFETKVSLKEYIDLMTVRDGDDYVRFVARASEGGTHYSEVAMIVHDNSEFVLMSFMGTIKKGDIGKLSEAFDIDLEQMQEMQNKREEQ